MRVGENPEKHKKEYNKSKSHRVVVVFYIPETEDNYFKELDVVLDKCLESLCKTVNFETTNITLINNNSSQKVDGIIDKYKMFIDKYVLYNDNKGKVYAVLNEVRSVFEPFVTISDADILFYSGWENAVFEVFNKFKDAGVVSPMPLPYLTFHYNQSVFGLNTLNNKIKYGKYVDDFDIEQYLKGTNLPNLIERKGKIGWNEKQLIIEEKGFKVVIGAYHVVSTYRTEQFKFDNKFPSIKFVNSYEEKFIDFLSDSVGLYRLSTMKTHAYHMGNTLDDVVQKHYYDEKMVLNKMIFEKISPFTKKHKLHVFVNRIIGRVFIKFLWNK